MYVDSTTFPPWQRTLSLNNHHHHHHLDNQDPSLARNVRQRGWFPLHVTRPQGTQGWERARYTQIKFSTNLLLTTTSPKNEHDCSFLGFWRFSDSLVALKTNRHVRFAVLTGLLHHQPRKRACLLVFGVFTFLWPPLGVLTVHTTCCHVKMHDGVSSPPL